MLEPQDQFFQLYVDVHKPQIDVIKLQVDFIALESSFSISRQTFYSPRQMLSKQKCQPQTIFFLKKQPYVDVLSHKSKFYQPYMYRNFKYRLMFLRSNYDMTIHDCETYQYITNEEDLKGLFLFLKLKHKNYPIRRLWFVAV